MGIFNDLFGHNDNVRFKYDGKGNPFMKMDDYITDRNPEVDILRGCWVNRKGQNPSGVFVLDGVNLNVPDHLIEKIEKIRQNPKAVDAIDNGLCGVKYITYTDRFGKTRNSVDFVDLTPDEN